MILYLLKRLFLLVPVLLIVATLVFFLLRLIPGDPVDFILGENALPSSRETLVKEQNFDKPVFEQYKLYLQNLSHGNLGTSYFNHTPVMQLIGERYPATLQLALAAIMWALLFSIPLGILSSIKEGKAIDRLSLVGSLLGVSVPGFYLGPLLVLVFSIKLDWFPVSGRELPGSIILPSLTMGLALAAILTRMTRSSMIDVLGSDYIRTAKAKGLSFPKVILKHALRSALIPIVAVLGLQFGTLLAGAVVTEKIFSWPGLGSLVLEAISRRDYAVVQGCVLVIATTYVLVNILTDITYKKIDPRIDL